MCKDHYQFLFVFSEWISYRSFVDELKNSAPPSQPGQPCQPSQPSQPSQILDDSRILDDSWMDKGMRIEPGGCQQTPGGTHEERDITKTILITVSVGRMIGLRKIRSPQTLIIIVTFVFLVVFRKDIRFSIFCYDLMFRHSRWGTRAKLETIDP